MVETGLEAYRFSISWSRLIPNGRGSINLKGLQYYNNLINELIRNGPATCLKTIEIFLFHHFGSSFYKHEPQCCLNLHFFLHITNCSSLDQAGIQPHVTLFNYDHPQTLEDEYGGWISRKIIKDFTVFADVCFREFGDRVLYWTTVNEPNIFAMGGYGSGFVPPARCSAPFGFHNCSKGNSSSEPYLVVHHMLLAHASAARLYKKKYQGSQNGFIGLSINTPFFVPMTNSSEDAVAVQRARDFMVGWVAHPLVFGDYPTIMKQNVGSRLPVFSSQESKLVKDSFDFFGLLYYSVYKVKDWSSSLELENRDFFRDMAAYVKGPLDVSSGYEFPIEPWGLQGALEYFEEIYGNPPIYIHENGQRTRQRPLLEDMSRVKYLQAYIGSLLDAIRNGSNTR